MEAVKAAEEEKPDRVRQCNEGRYDFHLEDEDGKGNVVLSIPLPKFLDDCLLSVDVHPTWVTVVIKVGRVPGAMGGVGVVHETCTFALPLALACLDCVLAVTVFAGACLGNWVGNMYALAPG